MWPPGFSGGLHRGLDWLVLIPRAFGQARGCHKWGGDGSGMLDALQQSAVMLPHAFGEKPWSGDI